jgi:hypothetical protein
MVDTSFPRFTMIMVTLHAVKFALGVNDADGVKNQGV